MCTCPWAGVVVGATFVADDLESPSGEAFEHLRHGLGQRVGQRVELVEDLAGHGVVDHGCVPDDLVVAVDDLEVEERAARLLAGGEVADLPGEPVPVAEPELDAGRGSLTTDEVATEEPPVLGESFRRAVGGIGCSALAGGPAIDPGDAEHQHAGERLVPILQVALGQQRGEGRLPAGIGVALPAQLGPHPPQP